MEKINTTAVSPANLSLPHGSTRLYLIPKMMLMKKKTWLWAAYPDASPHYETDYANYLLAQPPVLTISLQYN